MTLPMFDAADVKQLEEFAEAVQCKSAYGSIPPSLIVAGINVRIRAAQSSRQTGTELGDEDLRALYSLKGGDIQVFCGGVEIPKTVRARDHIVCVVGHEALHAIQRPYFAEADLDDGIRLGNQASVSPDKYGEYISCAVELPAHAVMIALELREVDCSAFEAAARNTSIYRYFAGRLAGASSIDDILRKLVNAARDMHRNLKPSCGT